MITGYARKNPTLRWRLDMAKISIRSEIAQAHANALHEIRQLAAVARIEVVHNVKVTFGRQS